jgi:hypothetical protein
LKNRAERTMRQSSCPYCHRIVLRPNMATCNCSEKLVTKFLSSNLMLYSRRNVNLSGPGTQVGVLTGDFVCM